MFSVPHAKLSLRDALPICQHERKTVKWTLWFRSGGESRRRRNTLLIRKRKLVYANAPYLSSTTFARNENRLRFAIEEHRSIRGFGNCVLRREEKFTFCTSLRLFTSSFSLSGSLHFFSFASHLLLVLFSYQKCCSYDVRRQFSELLIRVL